METSLNVYDYPEPNEEEEILITKKVYTSCELKFHVPKSWDEDKINEFIKEEFNNLTHYNQEIEEIE